MSLFEWIRGNCAKLNVKSHLLAHVNAYSFKRTWHVQSQPYDLTYHSCVALPRGDEIKWLRLNLSCSISIPHKLNAYEPSCSLHAFAMNRLYHFNYIFIFSFIFVFFLNRTLRDESGWVRWPSLHWWSGVVGWCGRVGDPMHLSSTSSFFLLL